MDENKNVDTGVADTTVENKNTDTTTDSNTNSLTMTQADFDKAIQSAEDKLRGKYSKDIKALQDKIKELTPTTKNDAEIELDNKLLQLESKQKEIEAKEQLINLRTALSDKNIDANLADYIKADTDIDKFSALVNGIVDCRVKAAGYQPTGHQNNVGMTKDKWNKLSYSEKAKFMEDNPELAKTFLN